MRELESGEAYRLEECLKALAEHHNAVSVNFPGKFPKKPFRQTIMSFEADMESGRSKIFVTEDKDRIAGFCKIDIDGTNGAIDYLIVLPEYRGKGYGKLLFERAADVLGQSGVRTVEIRIVDGNDAAAFYEKYGFRTVSHIMRLDL